jgi:ferredoxin
MKVIVDEKKCIGCGLCVSIAPEIFEMEKSKAVVKIAEVPAAHIGSVQDAIENCPVEAIRTV